MLQDLNKIKYQLELLNKRKQDLNVKQEQLMQQNIDLNNKLADVIEERQYYKKAIDIIYERSIEELKTLLNSALATIFYDRDFSIDIELTDKRGKSLQLKALEDGKPVNLKRGTGMGVKTVISAILQMYYLQCKGSKILMLDEKYSAVSEEYVPAFFEFLSKLCEFRIILITHDKRFLQYADKTYRIDKGVVNEF